MFLRKSKGSSSQYLTVNVNEYERSVSKESQQNHKPSVELTNCLTKHCVRCEDTQASCSTLSTYRNYERFVELQRWYRNSSILNSNPLYKYIQEFAFLDPIHGHCTVHISYSDAIKVIYIHLL